MGKIRGDIKVLGAANLLQTLSMNNCDGFLSVSHGSERKVLYLGPKGLRLVTPGGQLRKPLLGQILMRTGKITQAQMEELLQEQRDKGRRLGEIIAERGLFSDTDIENALREQIAEEIYDVLTWQDASFEFTEATPVPASAETHPLSELTLDANVLSVTLEATRRADEMGRIQRLIPDLKLVPERADVQVSPDEPELEPAVLEAVLALVDGRRPVERIVEESLYSRFSVLRTLYVLAHRGAIRLCAPKGTAAPRPATPASSTTRSLQRKRTVLLLSDMPTFRTALAVFLRGSGFIIIEGNPATDATEWPARYRVDTILLDVSIDTEDGMELCRRLRDALKVPVLVLAGNASKETVLKAAQAGARDVLVKPIRQDLLLERLFNIMKG